MKSWKRWTRQDLADALSMSRSWVSKWLRRLRQADPTDVLALHSHSRARRTPPASIASQPAVVQRILEIRVAPPENLQRVPGPEAILYYLHRDPALKQASAPLPRSQTTIWKILRQAGYIAQDRRRKLRPLELREPGEEVQFDLKDGSHVPSDAEGKQKPGGGDCQRASMLVPRSGCTARCAAMRDAETLLEAVAQFLCEHGLPRMLTFDNDPRFVGSALGRDFPSALVRFLWCVGVIPNIITPHRPDFCRLRREISSLECLRSACRCIGQGRSQRSPSSPRHIFFTTTVSGLHDIPDAACCSPDGRS